VRAAAAIANARLNPKGRARINLLKTRSKFLRIESPAEIEPSYFIYLIQYVISFIRCWPELKCKDDRRRIKAATKVYPKRDRGKQDVSLSWRLAAS